jgi:serine/threonine protein kinase
VPSQIMNARNELTSDLTTPLGTPDILNCFDALVGGRCTLPEFHRAVLETCGHDANVANGVLVLLDEYGSGGALKRHDFRPLRRELQRRAFDGNQRKHGAFREVAARPPRPAPADATHDPDPTRLHVPVLPVADDDTGDNRAAAPPPPRPKAVGPGAVLRDRYVLQEEIGRGGVGTVYRALDRNRAGLPRDQQFVALKVLSDECARRPEALQALRREFHQAQSLSHPGIVNVFDFDRDDETYFVTMELLDGESLGALMRRLLPRRLGRGPAISILRQLGDAIAYAHEHGVLHLDLKPGNVMVTRQGQVRILDFGLAETFQLEPWISGPTPAAHAATPAYASCEHLRGELPDVRDDIFSFSCLAYELLSAVHPFDRRSALEARTENEKPRRIPGLSRRQWRALKSGLAWSREDRPATMRELLNGLALESSDLPRARQRPQERRPARVGWLLAAMSLLAAGAAAALTWDRWPADLRDTVVDRAATSQQALMDGMETARLWATDQFATRFGGEKPAPTRSAAVSAPAPAMPASPSTPPTTAAIPPTTVAAPAATSTSPTEQAPAAVGPTAPGTQVPSLEPGATSPVAANQTPEARAADATLPAAASPPALDSTTPAVASPPATPRTGGGPGVIEFAAATFPVSESASMAQVKVRRRGGAAGTISFDWHTVDDSAIAGVDYAAVASRQTMAAGQTTATLLIPIVADGVTEHIRLFDVVISDAMGGARLGNITEAPVIIVDDD